MVKRGFFCFFNGACMLFAFVFHADIAAMEMSGDIQVEHAKSKNKHDQVSLVQTSAYLETSISDRVSGFLVAYYDTEFKEYTVGLSRSLGDYQVGVGVGQAFYDHTRHTLINPWIYYSSGAYRGYIHVEHCSNEKDSPWWFKGYFLREVGRLSLGVYGNSSFGVGPRMDVRFSDSISAWASVPVAYKPNEGQLRSMTGISIGF